MRKEIMLGQLAASDYNGDKLSWNGKELVWGEAIIPMKEGLLDLAPEGVEEVKLLSPTDKRDHWLNAAVITGGTLQRFGEDGTIVFVEEPIKGRGMAIGINTEGESYIYNPEGVRSVTTRKPGGSLIYGPGSVHGWVNMGSDTFQYLELCLPKYLDEGTISVMREEESVEAPMFWGLWRMLQSESLKQCSEVYSLDKHFQ